ncbi:hypothetical protein CEXT_633651 [Caerostris extrusa]|uniref:Uncharacterized protein n=1 Tax=Caerostris extrusa TaxID=172846 RepID=A0AAV4RE54_CAEEX|nr:hypothetical protein CEXT_633651 [Caerostris extrusa]
MIVGVGLSQMFKEVIGEDWESWLTHIPVFIYPSNKSHHPYQTIPMPSSVTTPPYNVFPAKHSGDQSGTFIMDLPVTRRIKRHGELSVL